MMDGKGEGALDRGGVATGGCGWAATGALILWPHFPQNAAVSSFAVPHLGQNICRLLKWGGVCRCL